MSYARNKRAKERRRNRISIENIEELQKQRKEKVEKENKELKETIINMSKFMFLRDNALTEIIAKIEKELRTISRRK